MNESELRQLLAHVDRCVICDRPLKNWVWAELNLTTNQWSDPDKSSVWPKEHSQGLFLIGPDCARKVFGK